MKRNFFSYAFGGQYGKNILTALKIYGGAAVILCFFKVYSLAIVIAIALVIALIIHGLSEIHPWRRYNRFQKDYHYPHKTKTSR